MWLNFKNIFSPNPFIFLEYKLTSIFLTLIAGKRRLALFKQGIFSNFLQIIDAMHAFIVIPLAINYVGLEGFGWWLTSYGIIQFLLLMDGGLSSVFQSRLTKAFASDDYLSSYRILSVILVFSIGVAVLLFLISIPYIFLAKYFWGVEFLNVSGIEMALLFSVFAGVIAIINGNVGIIGSASLNPQIIFIPAIISRIIGLVTTVLFFYFDFGILSIAMGTLTAEIIILSNGIYRINKIGFKYIHTDWESWGEWRKLLYVTFLARLSGGVYNGLEPTLIGYFVGPTYSAVYITCKKPATLLIKIFYSLWASSLSPLISYMATHSYDKVVLKLSYFYALVLRLSFVAFFFYIILNDYFLRFWVGPLDNANWRLFAIISFLLVSELVFNVVNESFYIVNLPNSVAFNFILVLFVRLSLAIPAAFIFGFYGLLIGVAISNLFLSVYVWIHLCKNFNGYLIFSKVFVHLNNLWIYLALIFTFIILDFFGANLFAFNIKLLFVTAILCSLVIYLELKSLIVNFGFKR